MKNILLVLGHPSKNSFGNALLDSYKKGALSAKANVKILNISELNFNMNLSEGYKKRDEIELEEDIIEAQNLIKWADHIIWTYPTWWGSMPAISKGFIDRVFLPNFAFKHIKGKSFPNRLLKGKSIRFIVTMDAPKLWFYLVYRASQYRVLRQLVFEYVGFKPVKFTTLGAIRSSTPQKRDRWLKRI